MDTILTKLVFTSALLIAMSTAVAQQLPAAITGNATPSIVEDTTVVGEYTRSGLSGGLLLWNIIGVDGSLFDIVTNTVGIRFTLKFKEAPDFENPRDQGSDNTYNISLFISSIRTLNQVSQAFNVAIRVTSADTTPPIITDDGLRISGAQQSGANRYLNTGDSFAVTLEFNEPLAADSLEDAAEFLFESQPAPAQDLVASTNNKYTATYTVQDGDNATSVAFRVSGVTDLAGNEAASITIPDPDMPGSSTLGQLIIDTTAPTVTEFTDPTTSVIDMQQMHSITFSKTVTDFDTTDITAVGATVNRITGSGNIYTITFTPNAAAFSLTLAANSVTDLAGNEGPRAPVTRGPIGISNLDGESGVSLDDAKFLYYAHTLESELDSSSAARTRVLGPLTTNTEDSELLRLLTAAKGNLSGDLNLDEETDDKDAAVLYYSFALEASLGDGTNNKPGIDAIKKAILGPLVRNPDKISAINEMLQRVYELR